MCNSGHECIYVEKIWLGELQVLEEGLDSMFELCENVVTVHDWKYLLIR